MFITRNDEALKLRIWKPQYLILASMIYHIDFMQKRALQRLDCLKDRQIKNLSILNTSNWQFPQQYFVNCLVRLDLDLSSFVFLPEQKYPSISCWSTSFLDDDLLITSKLQCGMIQTSSSLRRRFWSSCLMIKNRLCEFDKQGAERGGYGNSHTNASEQIRRLLKNWLLPSLTTTDSTETTIF
jgi:hypothetical protein